MMRNIWTALVSIAMAAAPAQSAPPSGSAASAMIEQYVRPYVETNNFSGVILAARDGKPIFSQAFGYSDLERKQANTADTRFHIASMSMQYTAAAALRLVMAGKLSLDTDVSRYVPELPNSREITIGHLLNETSGIRDINGLDDYSAVLQRHQTPQSLLAKIVKLPAQRPPGTYDREEHSAFNLLALIIERETGASFAGAVKKLVFDPLRMRDSGIDDDELAPSSKFALGYTPLGIRGLQSAPAIHWSAKAGNASAYTTVADQFRFVQGLSNPAFLNPALRDVIFNLSSRVGYGWFRSNSKRFGEPVYSMNGRAPGFSSAVVYVPNEHLIVVALSNLYASFTPDIADNLTAILLGSSYQPLALKTTTDPTSLVGLPAHFQFKDDFYQPNAIVELGASGGDAVLKWPTGDQSPLIPTGPDRYIDRSYGVPVEVVRNAAGQITGLKYDRFIGFAVRAVCVTACRISPETK